MYKTHNCGELRISNEGNTVVLSGWVHRIRSLGAMTFLDLRDRFGKTQLVFDEAIDKDLLEQASVLGREFVIKIEGLVRERSSKNEKMPTGDVEVVVQRLDILNSSEVPPLPLRMIQMAVKSCGCNTAIWIYEEIWCSPSCFLGLGSLRLYDSF